MYAEAALVTILLTPCKGGGDIEIMKWFKISSGKGVHVTRKL